MNKTNWVKVWDLPLRIFHSLLVVAFTVAFLTGDEILGLHVLAGYLVFGLLIFRLIWGFVGHQYARFSDFLCSPKVTLGYLKQLLALKPTRYLGHNPAGAVMIVLLLLSLLMTTLSGFALYGAGYHAGLFAFMGAGSEKIWESVHELFANFSLLLVIVHIAGVGLESFLHKENLAKAMLNGYKRDWE